MKFICQSLVAGGMVLLGLMAGDRLMAATSQYSSLTNRLTATHWAQTNTLPISPGVTNWPVTNMPPIPSQPSTNLPAMTNPPSLSPPGHN
ncbi:MAG TPA: hypothetical protein VG347_24400 [Verrucomicrobiae bacterium]|nr:hypothetical protein [Verrucomicrobiae bacterium]